MKRLSRKSTKPHYFIIKFPNGSEALIKCNGWIGFNPYITYFKEEYEDKLFLVAISWWEAVKFILKGKLFYDDK